MNSHRIVAFYEIDSNLYSIVNLEAQKGSLTFGALSAKSFVVDCVVSPLY